MADGDNWFVSNPTMQVQGRMMNVLQSLLMPLPGFPEDLYLRVRDPSHNCAVALKPLPENATHLALDRGHILSTDTFFGSFYRAYWLRWTAVRHVNVMIQFRGHGKVRVFEESGRGRRLLTEVEINTPTLRASLIEIAPSCPESPFHAAVQSRLFVEVEAERASELHDIAFVTPEPPLHEITLSIGLCTFNQERHFARTLASLTQLASEVPHITDIHVVNQGEEFSSPEIHSLLTHPKVHALRQRNLGGCGGFTRTLQSALGTATPATHHLMMDDDIVLDPRMILRALGFLAYSTREIVLGAGMLDSLQPTKMYEAGAFLRENNRVEPYCHNIDLSDHGEQWRFDSPVGTDFNAWWFCILPLEPCRNMGLPTPVFIRGDDFEYGQRLAHAGVPTVTLPGIAVWHEPFYAKAQGWQSYYDLRNRLIFGATYPEKVRQLSTAHVAGLITKAILTHSYAIAALRLRAVEDFLAGPDTVFARDGEALHSEIMLINRKYAPEALENNIWKARPVTPARQQGTQMAGLVLHYAGSLLRTAIGPLNKRRETVLLDVDAHPRSAAGHAYVLTNGARTFHQRFVPRRRRMLRQMAQAARLIWRFRREKDRVGRIWIDGVAKYQTPSWWAGLFNTVPNGTSVPIAEVAPVAAQPEPQI